MKRMMFPVKQSTFYIAKMDCPTEEQLIRSQFTAIPEFGTLNSGPYTRA